MLSGKRIILGITGGIAAYKTAELCRLFVKAGATVRVVMTSAAKEFITPLTLQTVSKHRVYDDLFAAVDNYAIEHVGLTKAADLFVIAPATANTIGKIAGGIADNLLTTTVMASSCPVLIAPAMNTRMYENPLQLANLQKLHDLGFSIVGPDAGELACGDSGNGRMASIEEIFAVSCQLLTTNKSWQGVRVMVTAGPTREAIDPVRYLTNHSSGKMGYAIAHAACLLGATVTLITGPVTLAPPAGVMLVPVISAQEMYDEVLARYSDADIVFKAAAVADYRPIAVSKQKIKKGKITSLKLVLNPDILMELGRRKERQILVGFAAETENCASYALDKLKRKNLDVIVANDLSQPGAGFNTDTNIVRLFFADGREIQLDLMLKSEVAKELLREVTQLVIKDKERLL